MTTYYPTGLSPCPQLTYGTDFYLWKMHMEVHLCGLGLWDIGSSKENRPDRSDPTPAPIVSEETKKKRAAWALILQSMRDPLFVKYFRSSDPEQCSQRGSPSVLGQDQDGRHYVVPSGHFLNLPDM
ncbi:hypothetical protein L873DRAFT_1795236 [Choiromyces venosus 120613-1]|uniref:DUF4219 domain-containing protein n=1 Tax=Choiromyces venosus 120613-1 TaxID=1336337 RepID=A0A3N4J348_9PEZI|nr:hypothetical protein L873DRAFT_1795236 [Choiromyces venosus 120613-1]